MSLESLRLHAGGIKAVSGRNGPQLLLRVAMHGVHRSLVKAKAAGADLIKIFALKSI